MYSPGSKFTVTSLSLRIRTYRHLVLAVREKMAASVRGRVWEGKGHVSRKLNNAVLISRAKNRIFVSNVTGKVTC